MAYSNATINERGFGTHQSDTATAVTLTLYQRVKFSTVADTNGAKPTLLLAGATDRGNAIVMQASIPAGSFGTVRYLNAPGEQFGIASGTIGIGAPIYTAASGVYSATQGSGVLAGYATTAGYDGGAFTFMTAIAAA